MGWPGPVREMDREACAGLLAAALDELDAAVAEGLALLGQQTGRRGGARAAAERRRLRAAVRRLRRAELLVAEFDVGPLLPA